MDSYYVELSILELNKAVHYLETAVQYMAQAGDLEYEMGRADRLIAGTMNTAKELRKHIMYGDAKRKK